MAVLVTSLNTENLDKIKLRSAISIRVFDINNQTAAAVEIAPPTGQNHGPGSDKSAIHLLKKSNGRELERRTRPPSKVPAI